MIAEDRTLCYQTDIEHVDVLSYIGATDPTTFLPSCIKSCSKEHFKRNFRSIQEQFKVGNTCGVNETKGNSAFMNEKNNNVIIEMDGVKD